MRFYDLIQTPLTGKTFLSATYQVEEEIPHTVDASGNMIDASGNVIYSKTKMVNTTVNRENPNYIEGAFDASGNYVDSSGNVIEQLEKYLSQNNPLVSVYFQPIDKKSQERYFDAQGYPQVRTYELDSSGNRYLVYKTDASGNYIRDVKQENKQIKKEKRQKINKGRNDAYKNLQVTVDVAGSTHTFDAHEKARGEFNGAVTDIILSKLAGLPDVTLDWTTADDQDITLTYDEVIGVARAIKTKYSDIHKQSRADKKLL